MATFGGPGSRAGGTRRVGMSEEEIHGIIFAKVVKAITEAIPELLELFKITLIEDFYRCYAIIMQIAAAAATTTVTIAGS